jgi:hypothetical protein
MSKPIHLLASVLPLAATFGCSGDVKWGDAGLSSSAGLSSGASITPVVDPDGTPVTAGPVATNPDVTARDQGGSFSFTCVRRHGARFVKGIIS